ncbi:Hypothetical_protein [Hexamita inflata]|uniref:Hypothetical_protein n=1 Tax=Hexamita inflata TaxID=28002 RepID=A0AA86RLT5_9EUKA|nr:Hypothetical protein HINF_LOCUS61897 [Hexamita inflata]
MDPYIYSQSYYRSCTKTVHILHFEKILRIPLVFRCSEHSTRFVEFRIYGSGDIQQRENLSLVKFSDTIIGMRSFQLACNFKVLKNGINSLETTLKATSNVFLGCNSL